MNRLRGKFILAAMISMFVVLASIVIGMNVLNYLDVVDTADRELEMIVKGGGTYPEPGGSGLPGTAVSGGAGMPDGPMDKIDGAGSPPPKPDGDPGMDMSAEAPYETRYFTIYLMKNRIIGTHMDNIAAITEEEARDKAGKLLEDGSESGFTDGTYRYTVANVEGKDPVTGASYNRLMVFVNCEKRLDAFSDSLWVSIIVSIAGIFVVFLLVLFSSKLVFRPVEASERKQKQFLTDASHELKTPLAIIAANTEVMELESGETKWTASTRHQVDRLNGLVEQMIALTRLDEVGTSGDRGDDPSGTGVSFSELVRETVDTYLAPAEVAGMDISCSVEEDIRVRANEKNLRQLVGILMDNAVKYATEGTTIEVSLKMTGHRRVTLCVFNRTEGLTAGDQDMLFERFYRADASRNSETGGSGIGLSVARSIVLNAGGRIHAYSEDGQSLSVTATLPMMK